VTDILRPPCELNILAVNDFKVESKVVNLKVTSQMNEDSYQGGFMGYAVRPQESFPFEDSIINSESPSCSNSEEAPSEAVKID
jgi:hypothetical protein